MDEADAELAGFELEDGIAVDSSLCEELAELPGEGDKDPKADDDTAMLAEEGGKAPCWDVPAYAGAMLAGTTAAGTSPPSNTCLANDQPYSATGARQRASSTGGTAAAAARARSGNGAATAPAAANSSGDGDSGSRDSNGGGLAPLFSTSLIRQERDAIAHATIQELWAMAQEYLVTPPAPSNAPSTRRPRRGAPPSGRASEKRKLDLLQAELESKMQQLQLLRQQHQWLRMREAVLNDLMHVNQQASSSSSQSNLPMTPPFDGAPQSPKDSAMAGETISDHPAGGPLSGSSCGCERCERIESSTGLAPAHIPGALGAGHAAALEAAHVEWATLQRATSAGGMAAAIVACAHDAGGGLRAEDEVVGGMGEGGEFGGSRSGGGGLVRRAGSSSGNATARDVQAVIAEIQGDL